MGEADFEMTPKARVGRASILTLPIFQRDLGPSSLTLPLKVLLWGGNWPFPSPDTCVSANKRLIPAGNATAGLLRCLIPSCFLERATVFQCPALVTSVGHCHLG